MFKKRVIYFNFTLIQFALTFIYQHKLVKTPSESRTFLNIKIFNFLSRLRRIRSLEIVEVHRIAETSILYPDKKPSARIISSGSSATLAVGGLKEGGGPTTTLHFSNRPCVRAFSLRFARAPRAFLLLPRPLSTWHTLFPVCSREIIPLTPRAGPFGGRDLGVPAPGSRGSVFFPDFLL